MNNIFVCLAVAAFVASKAFSAEIYRIESDARKYRIQLTPDVEVLALGKMHSWRVLLQDAWGNSVQGAVLSVDGGMPEHGHGLPTAPKVIEERGAGSYRIDGFRFNMPGSWELRLRIDSAVGADTASLEFQL